MTPSTALDIGAGAGKYGRLLRERCPKCSTTAIEVHAPYIAEFGLPAIYAEVKCMDGSQLMETAIDCTYELVIFGDVLEHFSKSRGVDILHFFIYRSKYALVLYPTEYVQNTVARSRSEAHISVWGEADFALLDHSPVYSRDGGNMLLIRGYLSPRSELQEYISLLDARLGQHIPRADDDEPGTQ